MVRVRASFLEQARHGACWWGPLPCPWESCSVLDQADVSPSATDRPDRASSGTAKPCQDPAALNVTCGRAFQHDKARGSHRFIDGFPSLCWTQGPRYYRAWLGRRRPGRKRDHQGVKPLPRIARGPISGSRPRIGWNIPVDKAAGVSADACASCSLGDLAAEPTIFMRPPRTKCFRNVELMFCCTKLLWSHLRCLRKG